ncbi:glycosyltransferase [Clostridium botulinum]|uniref:bifunctional glycosyltransferase/CDP-glycerol:glycerophosphate glycerophosphotransferase n=1 Tax=Clostridium botulinum TaxID=1491 RepID=UPI000773BC3C|nr:CDP-glycerol glycerophosphotransferase family protein [Clostridium botulinum]MBY6837712.1 CDP-glycerol glycerophosphotransferase family protein [Clostridium botulinum]NFH79251.1 glycosyltransferase [Clostridium botulinum]NFH83745.1 glycosyltransferase [Clostridium botulinum]NFI10374.1 glycosyltransferase [Clostridium botulinum]NFP33980.1 glycosyltransferase [Clostridium botulinum]
MCEISIIIPAYNVEQYLDECFESLINQTFKDFEIIVINDGSTDSTGYMLDEYSKIIKNLKVVNQKNSGSPGGPRNIGIELAKGNYIFMLDPDDILPYRALEVMHKAILKSKADFVCGNYTRFNSKRSWTIKHISESIFKNEKITTIDEYPNIIINGITCNKLYNKEFLKSNNIKYDEIKKNGEDRIFMLKVYLNSKRIHIIPDIVYCYREREANLNKSATQDFSLKVFKESVSSIVECYMYIKEFHSSSHIENLFLKEKVQHDLIRFINYYSQNTYSKNEWENIFYITKDYVEIIEPYLKQLPYFQRLKISYIKNHDYKKLINFCKKERKRYYYSINKIENKFKITDINTRLQEDIYQVNVEDLNLKYSINSLEIKEEVLKINGWSYFNRVNIKNKEDISKILVFKGCNGIVEIELDSYKTPKLSFKYGKGIFNYIWSGFKGHYNILNLNNIVSKEYQEVEIYLKLKISNDLYKEVFINSLDVYGYINRNIEQKIIQRIDKVYYDENEVKFYGWSDIAYRHKNGSEAYEKNIVLFNKQTNNEYRFPLIIKFNRWYNNRFETNPYKYNYNYGGWECVIPYEKISEGTYDIYIEIKNKNTYKMEKLKYVSNTLIKHRLKCEKGIITKGKKYKIEFSTSEYNREICESQLFVKNIYNKYNQIDGGYMPLIGHKMESWDNNIDLKITLNRIKVTYTDLIIQGKYINLNKENIKLMICLKNNENNIEKNYKCNYINKIYNEDITNGWEVRIPYTQEDGIYNIYMNIIFNNSNNIIKEFKVDSNLLNNVQVWNKTHYIKKFKLNINKINAFNNENINFRIICNTKIKNIFEGYTKKILFKLTKFMKKIHKKNYILRKSNNKDFIYKIFYGLFSLLPVNRKKIIMLSYQESITPNFEPIFNRINKNFNDFSVRYIGGNNKNLSQLINLLYNMATANVILLNDYYRHIYPLNIRKKTSVIQIWHATGIFKKFGLLALGKNDSNGETFELKAHKSYTDIVTSSEYVRKAYAEAFGLNIENTVALGVPRTDIFFNKEYKLIVKEKIYKQFPEIDGKKVILYAPTFRGNANERKKFRNQLIFNQLKQLKDKGYLIFIKLHPTVQNQIEIPIDMRDFIYDMTRYPNINELFLISDILITDYSSNIFEFSLLNKPIILFAYDLEKYLLERGFYEDYEKMVPGPICTNTEQLVKEILELDNKVNDYSDFVEKYLGKCDGKSTDRVVDFILKK